jgi:Leucine-rich repeat (LRR) protein
VHGDVFELFAVETIDEIRIHKKLHKSRTTLTLIRSHYSKYVALNKRSENIGNLALDMNTNQIEEIDSKTFESFTNLKYLFLNGNKLRRIEPNTFKSLDKLLQLTIYDNQIEEIDATMFETLVNLKELDLSCNKLKRIGSNLFSRLVKLEKLYLIDNQIEEIDENSFVSLTNLHELKLENNKLTRFIRKWFENLSSKSVKLVDLRKNPADVVSYFEAKFCARSKFDHTSGGGQYTSCWNEFFKQFPEPSNLI